MYVWTFRFDNIVKEFNQYGLNVLTSSFVGATKKTSSTLFIAVIWHPSLLLIPALIVAFLMVSAQYFHFKIVNLWQKRLPSLLLLILCIFIASVSLI